MLSSIPKMPDVLSVVTELLRHRQWRIRVRHEECMPPSQSNFFHFHAVLPKIWPSIRLVHPLWEILDRPLSDRVNLYQMLQ